MPKSNPEILRGPWASPKPDDDELKRTAEGIDMSDVVKSLESSAETDTKDAIKKKGKATNEAYKAESAKHKAVAEAKAAESDSIKDAAAATKEAAHAAAKKIDASTAATAEAAATEAIAPAEEARISAELDATLKKFDEFEERREALMDKYSKIKDDPNIPVSEKMQTLTDAAKVNEEYQAYLDEKRDYFGSIMDTSGGSSAASAESSIDSGKKFTPVPKRKVNSPRAKVDTTGGGIPAVELSGVTEELVGSDTGGIPVPDLSGSVEAIEGSGTGSAAGGEPAPDGEPATDPDAEPIPATPERTGRLANIMRSIKNSSAGRWISEHKREIVISLTSALAGFGLAFGVGAIVNNYNASPNEGATPIGATDPGYQDDTNTESTAEDTTANEDSGVSSEVEQTKGFHDGLNDPYMYTDANKPTAYAFSNFQALLESCNGDRDQAMEKLIRSDSNFAALLITRMNNQYRPGAFQNMNNYKEIETALRAQNPDQQEASIQELMTQLRGADGHSDTYTGWAHNSGGRLIDANGYATIGNLETVFSHTYEDNSPIYVYTFADGSTVIVKDTCGNLLVLDQEMETVTVFEGVSIAAEGEDSPDFTPAPAPPQQQQTGTNTEQSGGGGGTETGGGGGGGTETGGGGGGGETGGGGGGGGGSEQEGDGEDGDGEDGDGEGEDGDGEDEDGEDGEDEDGDGDKKPDENPDKKPDDEKPDDKEPDNKPGDEKPDENPDKKPDEEPNTPWGKEGTDANAGDQSQVEEKVDDKTKITEGENSKINEGDAGYEDDNHATPGASSESNGVDESGFADSGIAAPESSTEGTREEGGAKQDDAGVNADESYREAQEEIQAGQQVDAVGNENQEVAQENGGGGENLYTPEEEEALVNGGGIF